MDTDLRNKIDRIWEYFWTGGITNPLSVIEQITYLLFIKGLDDKEIRNEKDDVFLGITSDRIFDKEHQNCRWSIFKDYEAGKMFKNMQDNVFPFIKGLGNNKNSNYSKEIIEAGPLMLNTSNHKCFLYSEEIDLTPIEFSLLLYLLQNRGRVISSEELFEKVWKEKYLDCNNTVMVHIKRLREKLHEKPKNPKIIKTIKGIGYRIENADK